MSGTAGEWDEERIARWWQDEFTAGADPEYEEQILPLVARHLCGRRRVLDLGCGEGQVARHVARLARVETVLGVDPSVPQLARAARRGGGPLYARAAAGALPFESEVFDAVVACLVFEHVLAVDAGLAEVARVLAPGGVFLFLLNHPLLQTPGSGWIDDHILDEQYWRLGPYLDEDVTQEEVAPGVILPFVHRPLSRYVNTLSAVGLLVERMEEPAPPPGFLARAPEYADAAAIPRLLALRTVKLPRGASAGG